MEYLPLGGIADLVPEFAVRDLPLGRTLMIYMQNIIDKCEITKYIFKIKNPVTNKI